MTRAEWAKSIQLLEACWPQRPVRDDAAALWYADLAEHGAAQVNGAILSLYRAGREWMPNGAQILGEIAAQSVGAPEFGVAWQQILQAIRAHGSRNHQRVLDALENPAVRELASLTDIREIGMAPEGDTTLHAQARERYRSILVRHQRAITHDGLPSAARQELRGEARRAPRQIGSAMHDLLEGMKP